MPVQTLTGLASCPPLEALLAWQAMRLFFLSFRTTLLVLGFFLLQSLPGEAAPKPFAHEGSDLQVDTDLSYGVLPNGLRYVLRANAEPKGRAALRLVFQVGSLMEADNQQGLAHFLEHLSFNGSRHYPAGTMIEFFQRMGMDFGGDTNAYTSLDHTVYMIDLPETKSETLAEGLQVFSDYAGGLLLETQEIEKERGVVLAEKRARDSVGYRTLVADWAFHYPETRLPQRLPIGTETVLRTASRAEFLDLYDTWYRPDRTLLVAVGDFDVKQFETLVREKLSPVQARAEARKLPDIGKIPNFKGLRAFFHPEKEAPLTRVGLSVLTPFKPEPDTRATRLKYLPRSLAQTMLNRRLEILAKKEGAPFTSASLSIRDGYKLYNQATLTVVGKHEHWKSLIETAEQELRRSLEFGFQTAELKEAVANYRNALEQSVRTAPTRRSPDLARQLIEGLLDEEVITTPQADLELFGPELSRVSKEDCLKALQEVWAPQNRYLFMTGACTLEGVPEDLLKFTYETSQRAALTAPAVVQESTFAYTSFGTPSGVAHREEIADLGLVLVRFNNGVRLNLKKTDFEANRILVRARLGAGQLLEPARMPGLGAFTSNTLMLGGLGKHSFDELQGLLAGRTVGTRFQVDTDALQFEGATHRRDLRLQLELIAAHITDPGFRPEGPRMIAKAIESFYNRLEHTTDGPLQTEIPRLLANQDPRFGLPDRATISKRSFDEAKAWLLPQFNCAALELALVGDLDVEAAIEAVNATLGALPHRDPRPSYEAERRVGFPPEPLKRSYSVDTRIPKAVVQVYWPSTDASDAHRSRRLALLAEVLNDRMRVKIREELGDAYSPGAGSLPSDTYTDYGFLVANVTVDPTQAERVQGLVLELADTLAKSGVTDDELLRAKQPMLTQIRESVRTNAYWLSVLERAQEKPLVLAWARDRLEDVSSVSKADLDLLAKAYLGAARASCFIVHPKQGETKP